MVEPITLGIQDAWLELDIRTDKRGEKFLHFEQMTISDLHMGSPRFRGKETLHLLQRVKVKRLKLQGDIPDGTYQDQQKSWINELWKWPRQVFAQIFRMQVEDGTEVNNYTGNHDIKTRGKKLLRDGKEVWHRRLTGKTIYGIQTIDQALYIDGRGRRVLEKHGDDDDYLLYGDKQEFMYKFGDIFLVPLAAADTWIRKISVCEDFSIAAKCKWGYKSAENFIVNKIEDIKGSFGQDGNKVTALIDNNPDIDAVEHGHDHLGGIRRTPNGKYVFDTGTCTEFAQGQVEDRYGTRALLTLRKGRIELQEENGRKRVYSFEELDLPWGNEPVLVENKRYAEMADRVVHLIRRNWPSLERKKEVQQALKQGLVPPPVPIFYSSQVETQERKLPYDVYGPPRPASQENSQLAYAEELNVA